MALDWQDLWVRLQRMLWASGVLGLAGTAAGLWVYGTTLDSWHHGMPEAYADIVRPNLAQDAIRVSVGWLAAEWEGIAMLLWTASVIWLYLVPEVCGGRHAWAAALGTVGIVVAVAIDKVGPNWGAADQFVRFGVLLGAGCYLGIGWAETERSWRLGRRVLEGAVTGGVIGLLSAYGSEVSSVAMMPGVAPETRLLIPPVVWGLVVGWVVTGARECLGGSVGLGTALRQRWPLAMAVVLVLVNSVGPVVLMQVARGIPSP